MNATVKTGTSKLEEAASLVSFAPWIVYFITLNTVFNLRRPRRLGLESFSSDDGDGSEKVKKTIGLISKTTNLHVHRAFFVHFSAASARLRRENA